MLAGNAPAVRTVSCRSDVMESTAAKFNIDKVWLKFGDKWFNFTKKVKELDSHIKKAKEKKVKIVVKVKLCNNPMREEKHL